jgi:hypothetical protein
MHVGAGRPLELGNATIDVAPGGPRPALAASMRRAAASRSVACRCILHVLSQKGAGKHNWESGSAQYGACLNHPAAGLPPYSSVVSLSLRCLSPYPQALLLIHPPRPRPAPARRATMRSAWCSCPATPSCTRPPRPPSTRWLSTWATTSWAGAKCPPTTGARAQAQAIAGATGPESGQAGSRARALRGQCAAWGALGKVLHLADTGHCISPNIWLAFRNSSAHTHTLLASSCPYRSELGPSAVSTEPLVEQFFVTRSTTEEAQKLRMEQQVRPLGKQMLVIK